MKAPGATVLILLILLAGAAAAPEPCDIPGYFLNDSNELRRTQAAVRQDHRLTVAVVGTGSSILAGPDGPRSAYPARLEAALGSKLPQASVKVVTLVRTR